ncbi:MAG: hypothetical protein HZA54_08415, partial [Planctomycetes bacterium]|nr:hypothetical protein [Planctomycetota bacterium]
TEIARLEILDLAFALRLTGVEPRTLEPEAGAIALEFSAPIDVKGAEPFLAVEPAVAFRVESYYRGLRLTGPFVAGARYTLTLRAGLPAGNGVALAEELRRVVVFDDVDPYVRIELPGNYLSAATALLLPVESVNCRGFSVAARRVLPANLVHFARGRSSWYDRGDDLSTPLLEKQEVPVAETGRNARARTLLDLGDLLGRAVRGALLVDVQGADDYERTRRLVVISDLGVTVKRSPQDFLVWVNTLRGARPVQGAKATVFGRAGQELALGYTDADGLARIGRIAGGNEAEPFVVTVETVDDATYLELGRTELTTTDFDAAGRPYLAGGYEAHVYSDRGVYRPGESVHLAAAVRDRAAVAPGGAFPVEWVVRRADGRVAWRRTTTLDALGMAEAEFPTHPAQRTGRYRATLGLPGSDAPFGSLTFAVEEFVPPQLEVALDLPAGRLVPAGKPVPLIVRARHLFGAAAAGQPVEARATWAPARFAPAGWSDFAFVDATREVAEAETHRELGKLELDAQGEARYEIPAYTGPLPASGLALQVSATVRDVSGRTVTQRAARPVDLAPLYAGLAVPRGDGFLKPGTPTPIGVALVTATGEGAAGRVKLTVGRLLWHTVLVTGADGRVRYNSKTEVVPVSAADVEVKEGGRGSRAVTFEQSGTYRIRIEEEASGASASATVEVWGGSPGDGGVSYEKPGRVEMTFDKKSYAPGETAVLLVRAPFTGRALLTVETDRVLWARCVTLDDRTARLEVPVSGEQWPNAYCALHLIRATGPETPWLPHRAYGVTPIRLETAGRRLAVAFDAPAEIRPGTRLEVPVLVTGADGAPAAGAEITVAAVDEGICSLTGFVTPDPLAFFGAQRALGVRAHDLYAFLMPELEPPAEAAPARAGGDGGDEEDEGGSAPLEARHLNPVRAERFRPVALWQGRLTTDAAGRATASFAVPEFTGRLRLMAVAVAARGFGSAEAGVLVRRPLVVKSGLPRFLAPGDEFVLPVAVWTRAAGEPAGAGATVGAVTTVEVAFEGPLGLAVAGAPARIELPAAGAAGGGGEVRTALRLRAGATPGVARLILTATCGSERIEERTEIAVRPPIGLVQSGGAGALDEGRRARVAIPGDYLKGTRRATLTVSTFPWTQWEGAIEDLLHYPYGCIEQTTSTAFPLLYLADLAAGLGRDRLTRDEIDARVQAGLDRLLAMQTVDGGFSYWPGQREPYRWGSAYATHFLVAAQSAGYAFPRDAYAAALAYLDQVLVRAVSVSGDDLGEYREALAEKAYALFVLGLAGQARPAWANRLVEQRAELDPTARCHVAGALLATGRAAEGRALLGMAPAGAGAEEASAAPTAAATAALARRTGGSLYSSVRADAILLSVLLDAAPERARLEPLALRLMGSRKQGRWGTTQENAFAAMALGKYFKTFPPAHGAVQGQVVAGAGPAAFSETQPLTVALPEGANDVTIEARGEGPVFWSWTADGVPASGRAEERDAGLRVRRTLIGRDGKPLADGGVKCGDLVRVRLTLAADRAAENVVISDLLPAGLEIENPRLATAETGEVKVRGLAAEHVEMRDDRLLVFATVPAGESCFEYLTRAVTVGRFALPPVSAGCMYDPDLASVHGAGVLIVEE